jgi:tetratricopeptide (TPR) repeat protein
MNSLLLSQIRELCDKNQFDEAVNVIESAEPDQGCCADLLVWKAKCLQLGEKASSEVVQDTLKKAVACDQESSDAWMELGWFLLNVQDQPQEAQAAFTRALSIQAKANTELLTGLFRCAQELGTADKHEIKESLLQALVNTQDLEASLAE